MIALCIGAIVLLWGLQGKDKSIHPLMAIVWLYFVGITLGYMFVTILENNKIEQETKTHPKVEHYRILTVDTVYIKTE